MKKDPRIPILDIIEAIEHIEQYTDNVDEVSFSKDWKLQDAVIYRLAIIGEAAKNIPETIQKQHPDVPWRDIIGFRNVVIHEYSGVSLGTVWQIVKKDLPQLKQKLQLLSSGLNHS